MNNGSSSYIINRAASNVLEINLLFFPALPKKFTHYSYFMLLSLPIILIKFFLAILHAGSSGVVNVAGAAVKRGL